MLVTKVEDELTLENVVEYIEMKSRHNIGTEKEIIFLASHFYEMDKEKISSLDVSIINLILKSKSLVVESEHSLFEFIHHLILEHKEDDIEYRLLLSHLHLKYLKVEDIEAFFYIVDMETFIRLIDITSTKAFLECIYHRCHCPVAEYEISNGDKERFHNLIEFKGDKFDGIFSRIWKEFGGNPVANGNIIITETTNYMQNNVSRLIDPSHRDDGSWLCTTNSIQGGSFIIDFQDKRVSLNGYSLKAHSTSACNLSMFPKSWQIQGSNDKVNWTLVDQQRNVGTLNSSLAEGNWSCNQSPPFQYFKIELIDTNYYGNYQLVLHAIEFFGLIY